MTSEETGEGKTGIWFWKRREMSAGGLVAKTRCGNSWINGVGISTNPRDEEGKAIGGAMRFNDTTRHGYERQ